MNRSRRWWREPLLHFLLLGLVLFLLYDVVGSGRSAREKTIVVDRDALLTYAMDRPEYFDAAPADELLDGFSDEELQRIIDEYVREEILCREALALGLDRNDPIIRRRLVQKLEFISQDISAEPVELTEQDVMSFFEAHRSDYFAPAHVTFTHIFFDDNIGGREAALRKAEAKLGDPNARDVLLADGPHEGDPFLYHVNYVEKTRDHIARQFSRSFADNVFDIEPRDDSWFGPFPSKHGAHLVKVTDRSDARFLELDEVRARVEDDARRERSRLRNEAIIGDIIEGYDVQVIVNTNTSNGSDQTMSPDE